MLTIVCVICHSLDIVFKVLALKRTGIVLIEK